jgi:hypothetical protein
MSNHVISCKIMSFHVILCHIMSFHLALDFSDQLSITSGGERVGGRGQICLPVFAVWLKAKIG